MSLNVEALRRELLAWYRENKRDLPWRRTRDPYAIWVSEVMLQQTRVETVKPYWARFLSRFPTVEALAEATLDEVLSHWSGLGYYARGRALHRAAQRLVEEHGGRLPADAAALSELPGFGPYTVAAVASIAFGLDEPAVDGNVARVLTRWLCRQEDPRTQASLRYFRQLGRELLPRGEAGDWNQALMELGATICVPGRPACERCPVSAHCEARRQGRQEELPSRRVAKTRPTLRLAAALVRDEERVLLMRRPDEGLFASLWELPAAEVAGDARSSLQALLGADFEVGEALAEVEQTLTHRELKLTLFAAKGVSEPKGSYVAARFAEVDTEPPGGLSSVTRKALKAVARRGARAQSSRSR